MIAATVLALLPVVIVVGIAMHELRPWWRQLQDIRALSRRLRARSKMNTPFDLAAATEAYAAYLNAPRGVLDAFQQQMLDEDLAKGTRRGGDRLASGQACTRTGLMASRFGAACKSQSMLALLSRSAPRIQSADGAGGAHAARRGSDDELRAERRMRV